MRRLLGRRAGNASLSWAGVGVVLVATAWSVAAGTVAWTLFGAGLTAVLLVPPVAFRSPRATVPGVVTLLSAVAFAAGVAVPNDALAGLTAYAAVAAVALVVVAEIDAFTPVRMNRGFAVALVVMTTMTAAGVWELAKWVFDVAAGTTLVPDNETLMWRLVAATAAGVVAGVVFDLYLRRLVRQEFVPDGFELEDAEDQVDSVGDAVSEGFERVGITDDRQRRLTRGAQGLLVAIAIAGVVRLNVNVVVNAGIGLAATLLPNVLERDYDVEADAGLTLWIAVAVTFHAMGTLVLYQTLWGWHNVAHVVTGTLVAAIGYTTVRALEVHTRSVSFPPKFTFLVVVLFVFSAGVFWEIVEFTLDGIAAAVGSDELVLAQHGLQDTMSDLIADTVGALLVAGAATLYRGR